MLAFLVKVDVWSGVTRENRISSVDQALMNVPGKMPLVEELVDGDWRYADGTAFDPSTDFDLGASGGFDYYSCMYHRYSSGYIGRGSSCLKNYGYICKWTCELDHPVGKPPSASLSQSFVLSATCPDNTYSTLGRASDGRTCFRKQTPAGPFFADGNRQDDNPCRDDGNDLSRPAVPTSTHLANELRKILGLVSVGKVLHRVLQRVSTPEVTTSAGWAWPCSSGTSTTAWTAAGPAACTTPTRPPARARWPT